MTENIDPDRGVAIAGGVAEQRKGAKRRIPDTGGAAKQSILSFGCIESRVASVRRWDNRLR
jgi:hypothetical protein